MSSVLLERNSTREAEPEPAWRKRAVAALLIYEPIPSKDRRLVRLGKTAMFKSDPGTAAMAILDWILMAILSLVFIRLGL